MCLSPERNYLLPALTNCGQGKHGSRASSRSDARSRIVKELIEHLRSEGQDRESLTVPQSAVNLGSLPTASFIACNDTRP